MYISDNNMHQNDKIKKQLIAIILYNMDTSHNLEKSTFNDLINQRYRLFSIGQLVDIASKMGITVDIMSR